MRLSGIGFSKDRVNEQLRQNAENRYRLFTLEYRPPYKPKKFPLEDELRKLEFSIEHSYDTAAPSRRRNRCKIRNAARRYPGR